MNRRFRPAPRTAMICTVLPLALSSLCFGQADSSPAWLSFMTARIKPDMRQEFEGYMKDISAAYKKGGAPFRAVVQDVFGDLNEYTSVTSIQNFAAMDSPSLLVRVMGEDNWAHLSRSLSHCTIESHRTAAQVRDDLSIRKSSAEPYPFGVVTHTVLAPGRMADYETWLKDDYVPALKKGGVEQYWVNRSVFGGNLNEINAVRWLKKMADLDGGPILTRAVGAEAAAKINAKAAGMIRSQRLEVIRVRPDLSYFGPPPTSGR